MGQSAAVNLPAAAGPPRVLHIFADPAHGIWIVAPLIRWQLMNGYQVEIACAPGEYLDCLSELGAAITVIPISRQMFDLRHLASIFRIWQLIHRRRYQVVHTHTPTASFLGRFAARLANTPVIIAHMRTSWWDSPRPATRALFTCLEKLSGLWTSHIFTINCADAAEIVRRGIKAREQVTCLHCGSAGVDTRRFHPGVLSGFQRESMRRSLGLQAADFVVGFVGRMVQEKGIVDLLQAFGQAVEKRPGLKLLIVGGVLRSERDQSTPEIIQQRLASLNLAGRVIQTGFRDDIPRLIALMDVVALPSHREGFGMILAEAAAAGRPAITSDTRGGREAVLPGETGLQVPVGDIDGLCAAILELAGDPELCQAMGAAGRRLALDRFDERLICQQIQAVYERYLIEKGVLLTGESGFYSQA